MKLKNLPYHFCLAYMLMWIISLKNFYNQRQKNDIRWIHYLCLWLSLEEKVLPVQDRFCIKYEPLYLLFFHIHWHKVSVAVSSFDLRTSSKPSATPSTKQSTSTEEPTKAREETRYEKEVKPGEDDVCDVCDVWASLLISSSS